MPIHSSLTKWMGGKPKLASIIIVLTTLAILIIPSLFFLDSITEGVKGIKSSYQAGTLTIPQPSEKVKSWPLIGNKIYGIWSTGSSDLGNFIEKYKDQLVDIGGNMVSEER